MDKTETEKAIIVVLGFTSEMNMLLTRRRIWFKLKSPSTD